MAFIIQGSYLEISKADFYNHGGFANPDQFRKTVNGSYKYYRYNSISYPEFY